MRDIPSLIETVFADTALAVVCIFPRIAARIRVRVLAVVQVSIQVIAVVHVIIVVAVEDIVQVRSRFDLQMSSPV